MVAPSATAIALGAVLVDGLSGWPTVVATPVQRGALTRGAEQVVQEAWNAARSRVALGIPTRLHNFDHHMMSVK
jgi:hypothetical protein